MNSEAIFSASDNLVNLEGYEIAEAKPVNPKPPNPYSTTTNTKLGVSILNTKDLLIKFVEKYLSTLKNHAEICQKTDCCCIQLTREVLKNGET